MARISTRSSDKRAGLKSGEVYVKVPLELVIAEIDPRQYKPNKPTFKPRVPVWMSIPVPAVEVISNDKTGIELTPQGMAIVLQKFEEIQMNASAGGF